MIYDICILYIVYMICLSCSSRDYKVARRQGGQLSIRLGTGSTIKEIYGGLYNGNLYYMDGTWDMGGAIEARKASQTNEWCG